LKILGVVKLINASIHDSIVFPAASDISNTVTLYSLSGSSSSHKTTITLLSCPTKTSEISTLISLPVFLSSIINSLVAELPVSKSVENISSILVSSIISTSEILKLTDSGADHCCRVTYSTSSEYSDSVPNSSTDVRAI
jgi:hypothetical protein